MTSGLRHWNVNVKKILKSFIFEDVYNVWLIVQNEQNLSFLNERKAVFQVKEIKSKILIDQDGPDSQWQKENKNTYSKEEKKK